MTNKVYTDFLKSSEKMVSKKMPELIHSFCEGKLGYIKKPSETQILRDYTTLLNNANKTALSGEYKDINEFLDLQAKGPLFDESSLVKFSENSSFGGKEESEGVFLLQYLLNPNVSKKFNAYVSKEGLNSAQLNDLVNIFSKESLAFVNSFLERIGIKEEEFGMLEKAITHNDSVQEFARKNLEKIGFNVNGISGEKLPLYNGVLKFTGTKEGTNGEGNGGSLSTSYQDLDGIVSVAQKPSSELDSKNPILPNQPISFNAS